jgi:4a-hydroxytetrahydrobiopterin dehydratase
LFQLAARLAPGARHGRNPTVNRPHVLEPQTLTRFLADHPEWSIDSGALKRTYAFGAYGGGVGFAVAVAVAAERRDHHPDIFIGWRKVEVRWSTHDAGGITELDTSLALECDGLFQAR